MPNSLQSEPYQLIIDLLLKSQIIPIILVQKNETYPKSLLATFQQAIILTESEISLTESEIIIFKAGIGYD